MNGQIKIGVLGFWGFGGIFAKKYHSVKLFNYDRNGELYLL